LGSAIVVTILKKYNDKFAQKEHQSSDPDVIEKYEGNVYINNPKPKF